MKLVLRNCFLLIVFFTKNNLIGMNSNLLYQPNKLVIDDAIKKISNLVEELYESLLYDAELLINKSQIILEQIQNNTNYLVENKDNLDEMISDYKYSAIALHKIQGYSYLSKEIQIALLGSTLFGFANILSHKTKMQKILNDNQISTLLFLITAMGIEFTSISVLEKIMNIVEEFASNLKTDNLNDFSYEATIYDIFQIIAQKIIAKDFVSVLFDRIIDARLNKMKENIAVFKNQKNKTVKKTKNKK